MKAAFLYNFIRFVDWPESRMQSADAPLIVGVVGKDPFGKALDVICRKEVRGKSIEIRRFASMATLAPNAPTPHPEWDRMRQCHLVFLATSERPHLSALLPVLMHASILTVSEMDGFLEAGGMINFMTQEAKTRFEIHLKHIRDAKIDVRAKLLRLALHVYED